MFLDRRAFLVSYDPSRDDDGAILARIMAAVVPVVAGISLEYYFGYVDPTGYGCGTKLPHNVTSLLGVMDGAQSDLRTGLPWQMVEIHEPTRLAIVVECPRGRLQQVVAGNPGIERLVRNRWIWLACLDPGWNTLYELRESGFVAHTAEHALAVVAGGSPRGAVRAWRTDAAKHPSPNAGPVEASFAGALGVRLGGTLSYGGRVEHRPVLNGGGRAVDVTDIDRAVRLSRRVGVLALAACAGARLAVGAMGRRRA